MTKRLLNRLVAGSFFFSGLLLLNGCRAYFYQPTKAAAARLGEETAVLTDLRALPPTREKIVAAVYKFRDQTGQYKPSETGSSFSTAVTQGGTNILMRALEESNWFTTIERENVSNLLNERKIVRSSLAQYKNEADNLPPLLFAGVILEGGIVSYDANIITGGAGLRYFAAGGSTQYRQDRVTVYLRAVATKSGKILKSVYTSKTILSQSVDASLFRYVRFKRLLEVETGFTSTEPAQMAVTEAIEKAVYALVVEGIRDGLWSADEKKAEEVKALLSAYEKEKIEMSKIDVFGVREDVQPSRLTLTPYVSGWRYQGDIAGPANRIGYGIALEGYFNAHFGLRLNGGIGTLATQRGFSRNMTSAEAYLIYRAMPYQRVTPLAYIGGGVIGPRVGNSVEFPTARTGQFSAGSGVECSLNKFFGIRGCLEFHQPFSDKLDNTTAGRFNDYYLRATVGLTVKLGTTNRRPVRRVGAVPTSAPNPAVPTN